MAVARDEDARPALLDLRVRVPAEAELLLLTTILPPACSGQGQVCVTWGLSTAQAMGSYICRVPSRTPRKSWPAVASSMTVPCMSAGRRKAPSPAPIAPASSPPLPAGAADGRDPSCHHASPPSTPAAAG